MGAPVTNAVVGLSAPESAVGLPVTRQPPHRSRRAVFPHRALRRHSLPQADRARHGTACCSGPASLVPTGRFALLSVPSCPVSVSFAGYVSTPAPSPCERLSRSLSTMSWSDSQVVFSSPSFGRLHLPARAGTSWVSQVLWCFSSRMPRSFPTPADPRQPHPWRLLCFGFWKAHTIAVCSFNINEAVSSFRECGLPYGLRDSLCTLQPLRSALTPPPHGCNTRYEWLVRPCSTGTFTQSETPSFSWRTSDV